MNDSELIKMEYRREFVLDICREHGTESKMCTNAIEIVAMQESAVRLNNLIENLGIFVFSFVMIYIFVKMALSLLFK